jgi:hypothetical protein
MDAPDLENIRERLAEWDGFVGSATGEQWDDWGRREMGIAIRDLGTLLAETVRLRTLNADLLAALEALILEAAEAFGTMDWQLEDETLLARARAAVAKAKGETTC